MRLLLDTNILIPLVEARPEELERSYRDAVTGEDAAVHASAASLWEIAIKTRTGKLALNASLHDLPELIEVLGVVLICIDARHVLATIEPEPATRDPFDRLLLAQCAVEDMRLITLDRALARHPLAWRAT